METVRSVAELEVEIVVGMAIAHKDASGTGCRQIQ
jgi:hypothetical protein